MTNKINDFSRVAAILVALTVTSAGAALAMDEKAKPETAKEAVSEAAKKIGEKAGEMVEQVKDAVTDASKKAGEAIEAVKDATKKMVDGKADEKTVANAKPEFEDGKYVNEDGDPTHYFDPETEKWDWYSYAGNRTYHAECHVCHGPFGLGSSFAPSLVDSLKTMTYEKFQEVVINGQKNVWGRNNSVMPAFGTNKGVYCRLDDLYTYLKARSTGALKPIPTRSMKKVGPSKEYREYTSECLGAE